MKVLLANDKMERGGAETLLFDILNHLGPSGLADVQFSIMLAAPEGDYYDALKRSGCDPLVVPRKSNLDISVVGRMREAIKAGGFEIVHFHGPIIGTLVWLATLGLHIPMVQTIHGFFDARSPVGRIQPVHLFLTYFHMFTCQRTIFVSNYVRRAYLGPLAKRKRFEVVYNGIDITRVMGERSVRSDPTRSSDKKDSCVLGMLGNFNHVRDHRTAIKAFSLLRSRRDDVELQLAGSGLLLQDMKDFARELGIDGAVKFLGSCTDVRAFLGRLDCFVYSSRAETFGIAVAEALAFGLPVLVSDNGPFPEIKSLGFAMTLFRTGDADDMCHTMYNHLSRYDANPSDIAANEGLSAQHFSIEVHVQRLCALYATLLQTRSS